MIVLLFLLPSCGALFLILVTVGSLIWISDSKDDTKIKYHHFLALYSINPDKWLIEDGHYPAYRKSGEDKLFLAKYHYVRFGFFGTIAYWLFKSDISRRRRTKRENAAKSELIVLFQKDIDRYRAESKDFIDGEFDKVLKNEKGEGK